MKPIKALKKTIAALLIALAFCVPCASADSGNDGNEAIRLELLRQYLQGLSYQNPSGSQTLVPPGTPAPTANPRPYTGPTEVVAPSCPSTCPNGLAPNPFDCKC